MSRPVHIVGMGGTLSKTSKSLYSLDYSLNIVRKEGTTVTRFSMRDMQLPMYDPSIPLSDLNANAQEFLEAVWHADGMIWSRVLIMVRWLV